ncbi:hypothetical protein CCUS01_14343 [Colletotrichum cuscutae]|uniref:Uncharacterized protein n=1 Tax=Colletotrichum cuscutae TaxID=1209917 RepID=A0AAI9Y973_9PEZI|nr:hypothetical protein CCUS01_14343 [Colletotrichum cuscutae]
MRSRTRAASEPGVSHSRSDPSRADQWKATEMGIPRVRYRMALTIS